MNKTFLICICILASSFAFSQNIQNNNSSQNNIIDSISVIISPGTDDANIITSLETTLKNTSGVNLLGYCSNHNVFLMTVSSSSYANQQLFYNHVKSTSNINTLLLKEGKQSDISPYCIEFHVAEKAKNPELEKALLDK